MLEPVLTSADCRACQRCCTFFKDEVRYAPLFTTADKAQALAEFPDRNLDFTPVGPLWRIQLQRIAPAHYQCPLYAPETAQCLIQTYKPAQCRNWPFYLVRKDGVLSLACFATCPPIAKARPEALRDFAAQRLLAHLAAEARAHPEYIAEHTAADLILCSVPEAR